MKRRLALLAATIAVTTASLLTVSPAGALSAPVKLPSVTCPLTGGMGFAPKGVTHGGALTNNASIRQYLFVSSVGSCSAVLFAKFKPHVPTTPCSGGATDAPVCSDPLHYGQIFHGKNRFFGTPAFVTDYAAIKSAFAAGAKIHIGKARTMMWVGSVAAGDCGTQAGYHITGTIEGTTNTLSINVCFSTDSGTNVTGSYADDLSAIAAGQNGTILWADADYTTSSFSIS